MTGFCLSFSGKQSEKPPWKQAGAGEFGKQHRKQEKEVKEGCHAIPAPANQSGQERQPRDSKFVSAEAKLLPGLNYLGRFFFLKKRGWQLLL